MHLSALLLFAGALFINAGSPGPSIAALVARVLAHGSRGVLAFVGAMWIGEAIWLAFAVFGLALLAQTFYWAFVAFKYCGVVYLLYLAWRMWTVPAVIADAAIEAAAHSTLRMFFAGFTITLGNPKLMVFYLALLPSIIDLARVTISGWIELTATMLAVLMAVDLGSRGRGCPR